MSVPCFRLTEQSACTDFAVNRIIRDVMFRSVPAKRSISDASEKAGRLACVQHRPIARSQLKNINWAQLSVPMASCRRAWTAANTVFHRLRPYPFATNDAGCWFALEMVGRKQMTLGNPPATLGSKTDNVSRGDQRVIFHLGM